MNAAGPLTRLLDSLAGRYRIARELGRGGMATVYLAEDLSRGGRVALKVLHPELMESLAADRFAREVDITATLSHPHILPVLDAGDVGGLPYFTMPFVDGESLRERIDRGQLPVDEAVAITRDVADALAYAHKHGIIHRDIKPDNILLADGHARVADFGIARALDIAAGRVTTKGLVVGTPSYMSPEQASGEQEMDGRSDLYSLGCVLYEMLTGHPPFMGSSLREVMGRHAMDAVPSLSSARPDVPAALQLAIMRALAKAPADRFANAEDFLASLDDAVSGAATPEVAAPRRSVTIARILVAVVVVALAVAAVGLIRERFVRRPDVNPNVVAILPFRVVGDSTARYLREGMMDLLATTLSSVRGLRVADTRTVLAEWRRSGTDATNPPVLQMAAMSAHLGSGKFVLGDVVATSGGLALSAKLFSVDGGELAAASVQGPSDSLFHLVDRLSLELLAGGAGEPVQRLADLASASLPAMRAYLAGRAAFRRGEVADAILDYSAALETDSTFALAALGMASAGVWSQQAGQSAALRRGLRTGYALRKRLSQSDQLLFEAYVLPDDPATHTAAHQYNNWRVAAEAAPASASAQYEYGDRLYHSGAQLGLPDALPRATAEFEQALALDSSFAGPLAHLVEIAAKSGDLERTRDLLRRYSTDAAFADAANYVRWRAAIALGDAAALALLRGQLAKADIAALNRIVGFGQADGVGLADVDSAAAELRRRIRGGTLSGFLVHPAQSIHSWARNRGNEMASADAIELMRATQPIPPGFSIVYFDADQMAALDALFWDGDEALAARSIARLSQRASGPPPGGSGARATYFSNLCVVALWSEYRQGRPTPGALERLRAGAPMSDSAATAGGSPVLCATMLDGLVALRGHDRAALAVAAAHLDSLLLPAPYQFGVDFGNLVLAQLLEGSGDRAGALRAVRRRPYDWDTSPLYLTTFLREEGRLAGLSGDRAGASTAYQRYLELRAGADARLRPGRDSVRAAIDAVRQGAK